MGSEKNAIIITGPTCSGKSRFALELAKRENIAIINGDSMQVYDAFPILSAQPNLNEMSCVPHKLYSYVALDEQYSVQRWLKDVEVAVNNAIQSGLKPVIVGGTGMYIYALLNGIAEMPVISEDFVATVNNMLTENGLLYAYNRLSKLDPIAASKINHNDKQRISRALQVKLCTGRSIVEFWSSNYKYCSDIDFELRLILPARDILYQKINLRTIEMLKNGAIEEVKYCINSVDRSHNIFKTIGAMQILSYLNNESTLENACLQIQQLTRNYAKRQITWFKNKLPSAKIVSS